MIDEALSRSRLEVLRWRILYPAMSANNPSPRGFTPDSGTINILERVTYFPGIFKNKYKFEQDKMHGTPLGMGL